MHQTVVGDAGIGIVSTWLLGICRPARTIVIQGKEVSTAVDKCFLVESELWQTVTHEPPHGWRVVTLAAKDGVSEPAQIECHAAESGSDILRVRRFGLAPVRIECDADLAALFFLILSTVKVHCCCMRIQHVVRSNVGVFGLLREIWMARRLSPSRSQKGHCPGFIECEPHFDSVAESSEARVHKGQELFLNLWYGLSSVVIAGPPGTLFRRAQKALWQGPVG
mmetsp:Transcript_1055/g.1970  ORF Transcript_1055/g.1970 Transcript_1055/m.1970 type:complete len:223 (-) Transcript_1055:18-686(-)